MWKGIFNKNYFEIDEPKVEMVKMIKNDDEIHFKNKDEKDNEKIINED